MKNKFKKLFNMNPDNTEKEAKDLNEEEMSESGSNDDINAVVESPEDKYNQLNDKYLRLYSDFENFRKRTAKEKIDWSKYAGEELFKALLPIIDDFERGIKSMNETQNVDALKEGVNLIFHKLKSTLQQKGLEEIDSKGTIFNVDMHEAITNIPSPEEGLKGKVIDELEKGYSLNGKVIRFAKVVVGN